MTRRGLLLLIGGAGVAAVLSLVARAFQARGRSAAVGHLRAAVNRTDSAIAVGLSALRVLPPESNPDNLAREITRALAVDDSQLLRIPLLELRRRLDRRFRAEHLTGDTISVDGWELASTEVRLYALTYLARD